MPIPAVKENEHRPIPSCKSFSKLKRNSGSIYRTKDLDWDSVSLSVCVLHIALDLLAISVSICFEKYF